MLQLPKNDINIIRTILKNFKNKEDKATPIFNRLNESYTKYSNLQANVILKYCNYKNRTTLIVTWNSQTDKEV